MFFIVISVLVIIVSVLLILVILIQNSKGGGLSSTFASSNQIMGVQKTNDVLEKATWVLAISIFVLSLVANFSIPKASDATSVEELKTDLKKSVEKANTNAMGGGFNAPAQQEQAPAQQEVPAQK